MNKIGEFFCLLLGVKGLNLLDLLCTLSQAELKLA